MRCSAYAPSHLTLVFEAVPSSDPLVAGSKGIGLNIADGVICHVSPEALVNKHDTYLNGVLFKSTITPPVLEFFQQKGYSFGTKVEFESSLPISAGFGGSGAAALSLTIALNAALGAGLDLIELADCAHCVEVKARTGLGDVAASLVPGFEWRKKAGSPSRGEVVALKEVTQEAEAQRVFVASNGPISTSEILASDAMKRVNKQGSAVLRHVSTGVTLETVINIASSFQERVCFLSAASSLELSRMRDTETGWAAAVMIGDSIVSFGDEAPQGFAFVKETRIEHVGPRLL